MNGKSTFAKLKSFITTPSYLLYSSMAWRSSGQTNEELVNNLFRNGVLTTERVRDAMLKVSQRPHPFPLPRPRRKASSPQAQPS